MNKIVLTILAVVISLVNPNTSHAISWQTSCRVDPGAIKREADAYIFHRSKNHCSGGIFNQRAELNTENLAVSQKSTLIFDTTISMKSATNEEFIIFSVHDGRNGCAPPMSLRWTRGNTFRFDSDYTRGKGMAGCVENRALRSARYIGPSLRRDGTSYHLQLKLAFDGGAGFGANVFVNGKSVMSGIYRPSSNPSFVASKRFYMKHGVYSQKLFDYEMRSKGMRVSHGQ